MPLQQNDIDELKEIYLKESGETLSNAEACAMGIRLVNLFRLLLGVSNATDDKDQSS